MVGDTSAVAGAAKWIATALVEESKYLYGVEDKVGSLQSDLKCMLEHLQKVDANPQLVREDGQLRIFTQKIQELAFRAEDAIDTYIVDVATKIDIKNLFKKFACLVSHCYPIHVLNKEIEAIQLEIHDAEERFKTFGTLIQPNSANNIRSSSRPVLENYLHLDEAVVGIEDDINELVQRLTNPIDEFKVVGIVGTGGAGKTTLATQLFRHNRIASWFPYKVCVSVSQEWSKIDLLHRIFKQLKGVEAPDSEAKLVVELHDFLNHNQCLVILDDIWNKEAWDDIYPISSSTNRGCKFVLTTRIEEVPLYADNKCIIHRPQLLTEEQKWVLFSKVAVEGRAGIENNTEFEKLGKQMLAKCRGLPLTVVTLAGILRTKQEYYQWEDISKACSKYILKGKGSSSYGVVEDMLELSYLDLPTYLKPCFQYLAIFPEDWPIYSLNLLRMWIAEGFITDELLINEEEETTVEDVAMQLLDELAQRCIIQVARRNEQGKIIFFYLHDLMRELCIKKAKEFEFAEMVSSTSQDVRRPSKSRRIAIFSREYNPVENQHLRTLVVCLGKNKIPGKSVDPNIIYPSFPDGVISKLEWIHEKFKLLRVLSIRGVRNDALPKEIGNLIHLRLLSIVDTEVRGLPKSIRNLRNLLHLEYCGITGLNPKVPNDLVCKMENLRGLRLPKYSTHGSINRLGLSSSKNLQVLRSGAGSWMTKELTTLSPTVRNIEMNNISKGEQIEAIYQIPSIKEDRLCTLTCTDTTSLWENFEFDLQKIKHCTKLWRLNLACSLSNYVGTLQFPSNLVALYLCRSGIKRDDLMQVLGGLSKLKCLVLWEGAYLGTQLVCTDSAFPQLRELKLYDMPTLEEWRMEEGTMPCLTKLVISKCTKLKRLPESIRSITTLKELEIRMPEEFCRMLGYGGSSVGEDSYLIRHIPSVKVTSITQTTRS